MIQISFPSRDAFLAAGPRLAFCLKLIAGYTPREAVLMDLPKSRGRQHQRHVRRAMARLRQILNGDQP